MEQLILTRPFILFSKWDSHSFLRIKLVLRGLVLGRGLCLFHIQLHSALQLPVGDVTVLSERLTFTAVGCAFRQHYRGGACRGVCSWDYSWAVLNQSSALQSRPSVSSFFLQDPVFSYAWSLSATCKTGPWWPVPCQMALTWLWFGANSSHLVDKPRRTHTASSTGATLYLKDSFFLSFLKESAAYSE